MYLELSQKKAQVFSREGKTENEISLPLIFSYPLREDLIRRAFHASFTSGLQPKGRDPNAGRRTSAESFGINLGMARVPRVKISGDAALAPNTVGGRASFPPSPREKIVEYINKKEMKMAVISALSATTDLELVKKRGHKFSSSNLPIIIKDDVAQLSKASEIEKLLDALGVLQDVERVKQGRSIRAGKGKMRGRKYKVPRGPLLVTHSFDLPIIRAFRNLAGADVTTSSEVSIIHLAPGGLAGRLTIYTESSITELNKRLGAKE
ncbi:50S ribosomal protein L4 [Sulfuracidifex tepidarius]|uniref:Large ribosomal subunit protein uL4 n=1 Tax=Sulfuracidifex tepidarius TaxID=1294262 RepID=A0A510DVZ5_9CREN|nr:50S ribosomal protein L4 [Sulfuracidifex tepidarius]BBG24401.1 50S ribosomal protein L4 [Sulfuracidifex tepidarius]